MDGLGGGPDGFATFSNEELTELLSSLEGSALPGPTPPFLGAGGFQALQFLPRATVALETPPSVLSFPSTSSAGLVDEPLAAADFLSAFPPAAMAAEPSEPPRTGRKAQSGHKGELPAGRKQGGRKGSTGRSGSSELRAGHVSHSTVEKQRRDRINALIDELRELVPPGASGETEAGETSRRPKHVVLADTIALVKDLQVKVRDTPPHSRTVSCECEEVRSPEGQAERPLAAARAAQEQPPLRSRLSSEDSERSGSPPELPAAQEGAAGEAGVVVEPGESCLFVKVNCRDRRGLLSDIILALKSMPLEITSAAVTTTRGGHVRDVFEVRPDPSAGVSAADVRVHVQASLAAHGLGGPGDKRRRL